MAPCKVLRSPIRLQILRPGFHKLLYSQFHQHFQSGININSTRFFFWRISSAKFPSQYPVYNGFYVNANITYLPFSQHAVLAAGKAYTWYFTRYIVVCFSTNAIFHNAQDKINSKSTFLAPSTKTATLSFGTLGSTDKKQGIVRAIVRGATTKTHICLIADNYVLLAPLSFFVYR